jgi:PAS domain S-box-containing protein
MFTFRSLRAWLRRVTEINKRPASASREDARQGHSGGLPSGALAVPTQGHQPFNLLEVTLASIGDAVIVTDRLCNITFMNPVAEALTGWKATDARGQPLTEVFSIINEYTRSAVENPCERVLREGTVVGLSNHTVLLAKDGREIPVDDSAAPIRDGEGHTLGVVLVFRDVTDERSYVEAKERLAAIVESSQEAIIGIDLNGIITSWNQGAENLYGYTAEEAIGQSVERIIPPERRHELAHSLERLKRGEPDAHLDTVRMRKDGGRVEVSTRVSPIRNRYGEVIGASKVSLDISERKKAERSLRFLAEASAELATLVDYKSTMQRLARLAVPALADWCLIDIVDANGQIERTAQAHRARDKEAAIGALLDRYGNDWNSCSLIVQVLRSGKPQLVGEVPPALRRILVADDEQGELAAQLQPRSFMAVPITMPNKTIGALAFGTSESARRYMDADLQLALELARRAAISIENAQLYRELKEAQRQKDDFLAMLAHELRNPLAAIKYANDLSKVTGGEDYPTTEVIDRQVLQLSHLIDDLLDVSRITRNKIQLRRELIDASTLVKRAVASVRPLIEARRHRLAVEMADEPMPLNADPTRIEQVLVNLLNNAAKYTPEGGDITIRAFASEGQAVFKVKDTGLGIPSEMLPHVFELFTQVNQSLDRSQGGLGIGLTVVRRLTELHGGTVSATSKGPGQGSEFTACLPLSEQSPAAAADSTTRPGAMRTQKILVVDDSMDTVDAVARLLREAGHAVEIARDGLAALESARAFKPDVILLDLGLPGLDGFKVAQKLRAEGESRNVRLIAISGYGQAEDRRRTKEAGFDHHLVKPVDFQALLDVLGQRGC